jgi:hypothetical protein
MLLIYYTLNPKETFKDYVILSMPFKFPSFHIFLVEITQRFLGVVRRGGGRCEQYLNPHFTLLSVELKKLQVHAMSNPKIFHLTW